jgi:hypothetical protein
MTIQQVYDHYHLMKNLQIHQYRVAGVAQMICDHFSPSLERENILLACLLHDMGNIIKFDLGFFPDTVQPEGLEYWQKVQQEYIDKYGTNEHLATLAICRELGVSERVIELISSISFTNGKENFESPDLSRKICDYADTRVTPFGVVSLEDRLADLEKRYAPKYPSEEQRLEREVFRGFIRKIEEQVFAQCSLQPDDITESEVQKLFADLQKVEL